MVHKGRLFEKETERLFSKVLALWRQYNWSRGQHKMYEAIRGAMVRAYKRGLEDGKK